MRVRQAHVSAALLLALSSSCAHAACATDADCSLLPVPGPCCIVTCVALTCTNTAKGAGVVCRSKAGPCDVAEVCDGASFTCPTDVFEPKTQVCRAAAGVCDVAELCSGNSAACSNDAFWGVKVCRAAAGVCDVAEKCTGTGVDCPADILAANTVVCRAQAAASPCDAPELCTGADAACPADVMHPTTFVCRAAAGPCDIAENCAGGATCPADVLAANTVVCRTKNADILLGGCDIEELCPGGAAACPADVVQAAGFVCRPVPAGQAGLCDVAETCLGPGNAGCPVDAFRPATVSCNGAPAGVCDFDEKCTGTTAACPANVKQPTTFVCRVSAGPCDIAENCDGVLDACPADAFQPNSFVCRAAAGTCDIEERCAGGVAVCPGDAFQAAGFVCRAVPAGDNCDIQEACAGGTAACPADVLQAKLFVCRAAVGPCDVIEACDGVSNACPADARVAAGTTCRAAAGVCDIAEACDGTATACPAVDAKKANTVVCRVSTDVCDALETCDGTGDACPADAAKPAGVICRAPAAICDTAEVCDGTAKTCPTDVFKPNTATCYTGVLDVCEVAAMCTGTGSACPANGVKAATVPCRASAGVCDVEELCDGMNTACPTDVFQSTTFVCKAVADVCDVAELCTGTGAACPADVFAAATVQCRAKISAGLCDEPELCTGTSAACPAQDVTACTETLEAQSLTLPAVPVSPFVTTEEQTTAKLVGGATSGGMAVVAALAGAAGASGLSKGGARVARNMVYLSMMNCPRNGVEEVGFALNPTRLSFGGGDLREVRGAVVGNLALLALVVALLVGVAALQGGRFLGALAGMPLALPVFLLELLWLPVVQGGLAFVMYSESEAAGGAAVLSCAVLFLVGAGLLTRKAKAQCTFVRNKREKGLIWFVTAAGSWESTDGPRPSVDVLASVFDGFHPAHCLYFVVQLVTMAGLAALAAWNPKTILFCSMRAGILTVLPVVWAAVLLKDLPYLRPIENAVEILITLCECVFGVLAALAVGHQDQSLHDTAAVLGIVMTYIMMVKAAVDLCVLVYQLRKGYTNHGTVCGPPVRMCCGAGCVKCASLAASKVCFSDALLASCTAQESLGMNESETSLVQLQVAACQTPSRPDASPSAQYYATDGYIYL